MAKRLPLSEQVRRAVRDCGLSQNALANASGIDVATINRFVTNTRGLPMKTLDRLAGYLDLTITVGKSRRRTKR